MTEIDTSAASTSRRLLRRLVFVWLVVLLSVVVILWSLLGSASVRFANHYVYDRALSSHERLADSDIVIVAIDEDSLAQFGQWPWPRVVHADFLRKLAPAQPRGVIFDVLFTEPAAGDASLSLAMAEVPNLVTPLMLWPISERLGVAAGFEVVRPVVRGEKVGHIAVGNDADGVVRRLQLNFEQNGEQFNTMAVQVLGGAPRSGEYVVPFNVRKGGYKTISYRSVMDGEVDEVFLRDKYVLIGATAAGLGDQFITPASGADGTMAGIEIHANVLDGVKNNLTVTEVQSSIWLFVPIVLLMFGFLWLQDRFHLAWFVLILVGFVALDVYLIWSFYIWLPPVLTVLGLLLAYMLWSWQRLAALMRYAQNEWQSIAVNTGHLLPLLSAPKLGDFAPHDIELSMDYTHRLHAVVSRSLRHLPSGLLVVDSLGEVLLCNQVIQRILARFDFDVSARFDLKNVLRLLDDDSIGFNALDLTELDGRELNGAAGVFVLNVAPIHHNGQLEMWLINLLELTAERQAQAAHAELVRFLSHDLRTPQVSILAVLDLHPNLDVAVRNEVQHHVQRTLDWATDLVHLTQAKNDALQLVELNFAALAQETVDEMYVLAHSKNIQVSLSDELYDELWLRADKSLLSRAVMNILTNAVRYSDIGAQITLCFIVRTNEVALQISDNGVGMSTEQLDALSTESNVHLNLYAPDAAGSLGVGLNMVYAVMRRHNGRLDISSKTGLGSVFTLVLPRHITTK